MVASTVHAQLSGLPSSGHGLIVCHNPLHTFVYQLIRLANCQMEVNKVWADSVSLATTPEIVVYFLFLEVLRCFSSPAYRKAPHSREEQLPIINLQLSMNYQSSMIGPSGLKIGK